MLITRCHRLSTRKNLNRPIIARFALDRDRWQILNRTHMLKNTDYFIREDLPEEMVNRRKLMYPMFVGSQEEGPQSQAES